MSSVEKAKETLDTAEFSSKTLEKLDKLERKAAEAWKANQEAHAVHLTALEEDAVAGADLSKAFKQRDTATLNLQSAVLEKNKTDFEWVLTARLAAAAKASYEATIKTPVAEKAAGTNGE